MLFTDRTGRTPLHRVAPRNEIEMKDVELVLMAAGANFSARYGELEKSVVHDSAYCGHQDFLRAVIEHGADGREYHRSIRKNTSTFGSVTECHRGDRYARGNWGPHRNTRPTRFSASSLCCSACCPNTVPRHHVGLLKHGAGVNPQDVECRTPLYIAASDAEAREGAADVAEALLRSGADETIPDHKGYAAADGAGKNAVEDGMGEEVDRVRELLANAPADRAWRRRGYLVLCRAHPDRVQLVHESSSAPSGAAALGGGRGEWWH